MGQRVGSTFAADGRPMSLQSDSFNPVVLSGQRRLRLIVEILTKKNAKLNQPN